MDGDALGTHQLIAAFVDELARCGVTRRLHLARVALDAARARARPRAAACAAHSHIDERTSGFFALGAAKASGRPVAVTCTSGTAAANLLPGRDRGRARRACR